MTGGARPHTRRLLIHIDVFGVVLFLDTGLIQTQSVLWNEAFLSHLSLALFRGRPTARGEGDSNRDNGTDEHVAHHDALLILRDSAPAERLVPQCMKQTRNGISAPLKSFRDV